jgi:CelD/BcsL family acetyltransferase involved in cellulose biosynthesis
MATLPATKSVAAPPVPSRPATSISTTLLQTPGELSAYRAEWDDLARHALEPNPFYEPWTLVAAAEAFAAGEDVRFLLLHEVNGTSRRLAGLLPLVRRRGYKGLPVSFLTLWRHPYCFCGTPLLRSESALACLDAYFAWAARGPWACGLVAFPQCPVAGPWGQLLLESGWRHSRLSYVDSAHNRALFRRRRDAAEYLALALSTRRRKELRRQERRLRDLGRLEYRVLERADELKAWTDAFLELEAGGWKGRQGTALASQPSHQEFFTRMVHDGFATGQVELLGMFLDNKPLAMKCNLRSADTAYAFKIAFAEDFAQFSPGVHLELFNIQHLHARPELEWMDSCADPHHFMIDRLWLDRRSMQTVIYSTGRVPGDLVVSVLPALRWLKRTFIRSKPHAAAASSKPDA